MKPVLLTSAVTLLWISVVGSAATGATDETAITPFVEVTISPTELQVGSPVTLSVSVFVPTWFPKPPTFPSFELANTITQLPPNSSRPTNKRVNGELWSGIVRNYQIYPLVAATYRLTDRTLPITYADPETRNPVTSDVAIPAIEFKALVPSGAGSLDPYLAGSRLALDRTIEGSLEDLQTGDAIIVRYSVELDHMPGIFLPSPAPVVNVSGIAAYPAEPVVEAGPPARRVDKVTYVFEAGGSYELPSLTLNWWNSDQQELSVTELAPLSLSVSGSGKAEQTIDNPVPTNWLQYVIWLLAIILTAYGLYRIAPRLGAEVLRWRTDYLQSEAHAFKQLRNAVRSGDLRRLENTLNLWIDRFTFAVSTPAMSTTEFVAQFGSERLAFAVAEIKRSLYSVEGVGVSLDHQSLEQDLRQARRRAQKSRPPERPTSLNPINP